MTDYVESAGDKYLEQTFVASDFVCGVGYGAQIVLYIACARYLWAQRGTRVQTTFLLAYTTLLILISTLFMVVQAKSIQDMYIDNRNYPGGGPWAWFLATQNLPINVLFYAVFFVLTFLSDLLVLWRCWVIWTASGRFAAYIVTFFPAVLLLASFAMGTLWTLQSSQPGLSLYSKLPEAYGLAYYVLSLSVNIIITILISARLFMYRRTLLLSLPAEHAKHYVSLATIIVESAALYSVLALIFIVTYAIDNALNQIFLAAAGAAQQIAGFLIIYRLAEGRAWDKNTLVTTRQALPPMRFGTAPTKSEQTGTTMSAFQTNTVGSLSPMPAYIKGETSYYDEEANAERYDSSTLGGSPITPIKENVSIWSRLQGSKPSQTASLP